MAIAIAIKLDSPGPVLFRQLRCGLHGRPFTFLKFRTMRDDAEARRKPLCALNEMDGPAFKMTNDPRVTPLGRFLRRTSLDELPQLWNVLRGDMSLVGPRPPSRRGSAPVRAWQRRRLSMKPGLTCLWQVNGRNELTFDEWMRLDLEYIDNWSLWLDVKIPLKTIPAVLLVRAPGRRIAASFADQSGWSRGAGAGLDRIARFFMPGACASRRSQVTSDASSTSARATYTAS